MTAGWRNHDERYDFGRGQHADRVAHGARVRGDERRFRRRRAQLERGTHARAEHRVARGEQAPAAVAAQRARRPQHGGHNRATISTTARQRDAREQRRHHRAGEATREHQAEAGATGRGATPPH